MKIWSVWLLLLAVLPAQQWYRSNQSGMQIDQINGPLAQGWSVLINGGSKILYFSGKEKELWEESLVAGVRGVDHWVAGERREFFSYRSDGLLSSIEYFAQGQAAGRDRYYYRDRLLNRIEHYDPQGKLVWRKDYQRRSNGSMVSSAQRQISDTPAGSRVLFVLIQAGRARLTQRGDSQRLELFDRETLLRQRLEYRGDKLWKDASYFRQNGRLLEERVSYPETSREEVRRYNLEGKLLNFRISQADRLSSEIDYRYNAEGLLLEEVQEGSELITLRYRYRPGLTEPDSIDYYQRGLLVRTRFDFLPEPASYSERFYVAGRPVVLRVYRSNALTEEKLLAPAIAPPNQFDHSSPGPPRS